MSKNKLKEFDVWADVKVYTSLKVRAETLEDALALARDLTVDDFVSVIGEHCDSELTVKGVLA